MELAQCPKMQVQCPQGVGPGGTVQVTAPSGQQMQVQVPPGVGPGMIFEVSLPMATPAAVAMPVQPQIMQTPMQPQMMQAAMQPQMMQQQIMPQRFGSPYEALASLPRVEVQEKANVVQALTALVGLEVDMANKYKVKDAIGQEYFFIVETTDWCTRNMKRGCCADCVGWESDVLYTFAGAQQKFLHMERPWTLTCCCFNRPILHVQDVMTGQHLGSIRDPFACCDLTFSLLDPAGHDVLFVKGGCCQPGLCCPLPCGPCATVHFDITDAQSGHTVGSIDKKVPSCLKWLIPGASVDNYQVDFKDVTHPQWKALVMVLSVFIDFRYFSETQDPDSVANNGGNWAGALFG